QLHRPQHQILFRRGEPGHHGELRVRPPALDARHQGVPRLRDRQPLCPPVPLVLPPRHQPSPHQLVQQPARRRNRPPQLRRRLPDGPPPVRVEQQQPPQLDHRQVQVLPLTDCPHQTLAQHCPPEPVQAPGEGLAVLHGRCCLNPFQLTHYLHTWKYITRARS